MIKILTVVGARPQFIKAATISRCIANYFADEIEEIIVHSGQHYDANMSANFFQELGIPKPKYQFDSEKNPLADHLSQMKNNIELAIQNENPDLVLLYGDTNTTLSGTYAATNAQIPIAHIEAGLRSYDNSMPEEFNRYTCDHASTLLFTPSEKAFQNLLKEGFDVQNKHPFCSSKAGIFNSGDVMYDSLLHASKRLGKHTDILKKFDLNKNNYLLATIHRNFNTDNPKRLNEIFEGFDQLSKLHSIKIIIPLHPRTKKQLKLHLDPNLKINNNPLIKLLDPLSYLETINLLRRSKMVITDSGGLQKESFFLKKPCLIARSSTEWTEITDNRNAILYDANPAKLLKAYEYYLAKKDLNYPSFYGNGKAAKFICKKIIQSLKNKKE